MILLSLILFFTETQNNASFSFSKGLHINDLSACEISRFYKNAKKFQGNQTQSPTFIQRLTWRGLTCCPHSSAHRAWWGPRAHPWGGLCPTAPLHLLSAPPPSYPSPISNTAKCPPTWQASPLAEMSGASVFENYLIVIDLSWNRVRMKTEATPDFLRKLIQPKLLWEIS